MRDARHVGGVRSSMCFGRERSSWSCESRAGDRRHPLGGRAAPRAVGDKVHGPRKLHLRHQRVARASLYQYTRALSGEALSNTQATDTPPKSIYCVASNSSPLDSMSVWCGKPSLSCVSSRMHTRAQMTLSEYWCPLCRRFGLFFRRSRLVSREH